MNYRELLTNIASKMSLSKEETEQMLNDFTSTLVEKIEANDKIELEGIGGFELVKKEERIVLDYETGLRRIIPPRLLVKYNQDVKLSNKLNS